MGDVGGTAHGGRLIVVSYLVSRSPEAFYQLLVSEKVTILCQTPSAFRQLNAAEEALPQQLILSLRLVIFAGERSTLAAYVPGSDDTAIGPLSLSTCMAPQKRQFM